MSLLRLVFQRAVRLDDFPFWLRRSFSLSPRSATSLSFRRFACCLVGFADSSNTPPHLLLEDSHTHFFLRAQVCCLCQITHSRWNCLVAHNPPDGSSVPFVFSPSVHCSPPTPLLRFSRSRGYSPTRHIFPSYSGFDTLLRQRSERFCVVHITPSPLSRCAHSTTPSAYFYVPVCVVPGSVTVPYFV